MIEHNFYFYSTFQDKRGKVGHRKMQADLTE